MIHFYADLLFIFSSEVNEVTYNGFCLVYKSVNILSLPLLYKKLIVRSKHGL